MQINFMYTLTLLLLKYPVIDENFIRMENNMVYEKLRDISARYGSGIVKAVNTILSYDIEGLRSIVLFGSCARLNIHVGSDIDLLVVTKDHILDRILKSNIRNDIEELPNGLAADVVFSTVDICRNSDLRLYKDIRTQGIILWKDGEFTDEYEQLLCACTK